MKMMEKYLLSLAMVAMTACSSMEVDADEAVAGNFPSDFNRAEYAMLHPELVAVQVRDYVTNYNTEVKATLAKDSIDADVAAFKADTALLHVIFTNPNYGGIAESRWVDAWTPKVLKDTSCAEGVKVYNPDECVIVDSLAPGKLNDATMNYLTSFNFTNTRDDLTLLAAVKIDSTAVEYQYVMFGRDNGWAYRFCKDVELNNPIYDGTFPAQKLYCADANGLTHEIIN